MKHIEQILNIYYADNAKKLHRIVDRILLKFGGLSDKDKDDFYSLANKVFVDVMKKYDNSQSFDGFLYSCLCNKIKTEITRRNREKRKADRMSISIDTPVGDDENSTIGDMIADNFDIENIVIENNEDIYDEKIEKFLNQLTKIQRAIIELKMNNVSARDIKQKLKLSDSQYNQNCEDIKNFNNIKILFDSNNQKEDKTMSTKTQTMENCKTDRISIASIIKKIDKHTIRFDHPLQRESDQWSPSMKGNLVSDILQGNKLHPLIFAEQIINGVAITWDLDGKQRCTNAYSFSNNGYRVSKNIRRWLIKYTTTKKDENGNDVLDEGGFPTAINAEFDIRGKKFSDLPEELQDRFLDYSFNYDMYLNCSEEDIGYHIERYNDGKPMTPPQKGIMKLGTGYAEIVKSISNMPFFKDMGGYKVNDFKKGTINRVVVESIMAANYLDKWNKFDDMCKHIKENADISVFDNFEDMVERLEKVVTDDVSDMFNSKDSFLWFGLFAKFVQSETDDQKFIEFMTEFVQSLHSKSVDGVSFDDILESGNTKDKGIVTKKMKHLEQLMDEFLDNCSNSATENKDSLTSVDSDVEFMADVLKMDMNGIYDDMDIYNEDLDTLLDNTVKVGSKLRDKENRVSLLAMVVYSYVEDVKIDDWFAEYVKKDTYYVDQKVNFVHMKNSFEQYCKEHKMSA